MSRIKTSFICFICIFSLATMNELCSQSSINPTALKSLKIINETKINTAGMESSPAFIGDKIAYVYTPASSKFLDKQINAPFFNLAEVSVDLDNSLFDPVPYGNKINSETHEGPMAYLANENKMFLTRSVVSNRQKLSKKDTVYSYLRILEANLNITNPQATPIALNVAEYSVCHPALSTNGQMMIYASNKPGALGGMDLYFSYFDGSNWVADMTAGPNINSASNEIFPTLVNDTILLFASDRPGGYGGLDLYVSIYRNGIWTMVERLPSPFNSSFDDLSLIVRPSLRTGYFTSNRPGGKGGDDIYRFESDLPIFGLNKEDSKIMANLQVLNKLTLEPIQNAKMTLSEISIDINSFNASEYNMKVFTGRNSEDVLLKIQPKNIRLKNNYTSDEEGYILFEAFVHKKYIIRLEDPEHEVLSVFYDHELFGDNFHLLMEPNDEDNDDFEMDGTNADNLMPEDVTKDSDDNLYFEIEPGRIMSIDNIYYSYNSSVLNPNPNPELDELASILDRKKEIRIRIESHTDSRGSDAYNLQLSIKRAGSVRDYLVAKGISGDRIIIRGFGESKILNHCKDGIPCTDAQHRLNRRTQIVFE